MYLNSLARGRYPINYIYGFASEGFSYFLTTQMKETSPSQYHTRLVRVCHDDSDYYSYTEIPIQCTSNDKDYTLVQVRYSYSESPCILTLFRLLLWGSLGLVWPMTWGWQWMMMCCLVCSVLLIVITQQHQVTAVHCVFTHCRLSDNNSWQTYRDVPGGKERGG